MPDGMLTRNREIVFKRVRDKQVNIDKTSGFTTQFDRYVNVSGTQITASEGHPFAGKRKSLLDLGGPFRTQRNEIQFDGANAPITRNMQYNDGYRGHSAIAPVFLIKPGATGESVEKIFYSIFPKGQESSDAELMALGTTAIARCKPTNSIANLAVTLAELKREGIPHLIGSASWRARAKSAREKQRALGGDYLNVQFGWVPLISDIKNAVRAAQDTEKILAQFRRDDGRVVRRQYEFPLKVETSERTIHITGGGFTPTGSLSYRFAGITAYNKGYDVKITTTVEKRRWFSGAFTYHMPIANNTLGRIARASAEARKLYGLSIDPEVIWNILPWSWAIDWAVNIGDLLSNASDAMTDGLVMPYGYMMETSVVTDHYEGDIPGVGHTSMTLKTIVKKRVRASPYGFGVTWDGLNPYQLSILAALGISRGRHA